MKAKHSRELKHLRTQMSDLRDQVSDLEEQLAEAQRKQTTMRLEAQVETLKAELEAARRNPRKSVSPPPAKDNVVTPVMPAQRPTPGVTPRANTVTPMVSSNTLTPMVTPLQHNATPGATTIGNANSLTPYDPLMPDCATPTPMSLQVIAQQLLRGRRPTRRQLPFRTPPLADPRAAYGGYGWVGY